MRGHRNTRRTGSIAVKLAIICACFLPLPPLFTPEPKPRTILKGHTKQVVSLAFSPDGKTLASGSADNSIKLWDVATGKNISTLEEAAEYWVDSLAFSPNGKTLASGCGGNIIKLWNVATGKSTNLLDKVSEYASPEVVFSPDGKTLASGGKCISEMKLWDVATGKCAATLEGYDDYGVRAMSFSPDGKTLVSLGRQNDKLKVWDVATGKNTANLKNPDDVFSAAFSPDAKILATASWGDVDTEGERIVIKELAYIKLWEVATGKELATLKGQARVWTMVFSPNGKTLASWSRDGFVEENGKVTRQSACIKLWDVATGKQLATFKGLPDGKAPLAFSPDGKMLAFGSEDKTIMLWDVASGARNSP